MTKSKDQVTQSIKELYQNQNKIPPFIEDMEGIKEYDMKEYYVRLKIIIKEKEEPNKSNYEEVVGEKINIEVNDIFDQSNEEDAVSKVLILGGAGVGKSTLMQYMAFKWSDDLIWKDMFDVVYRVALKTLLNSNWKAKYLEENKYASEIDKEPLRYIIHYNIVRTVNNNLLAKELLPEDIDFTDSRKILFLLDGYDEVAHMDDPLFKKLESQIFQQKNLILTSRPNAIIPSFKKRFERIIENIGLDNDGIDLYTQLYFKGNTPQIIKKYEAIDQFLSINASVKNICNVPVNIAMLCYIFQNQEDGINLQISNASQLYYLVVQKLGERYISKEYKGIGFESQSLKDKIEEKLRNLHEIRALKHIAYSGMTGGGVEINDNIRQESLIIKSYKDTKDEYSASIQKSIESLNLKTNINKIVKYGLLKQEGENLNNRDYSFIHLSFQEYLTAQYLTDKLLLGSEKEKVDIITYISTHRNEPRLLMTLKFMAGIISNQKDTEILNDFWNSVVCNVDGILEFSLGYKIKLLMNLLGQAKIKDKQLDSRIPNFSDIINLIDVVVISNISSFKETLKESDYLSHRMHLLISKYVEESRDSSFEILQEMKIPNSHEPIQQLINHIVDQQKEQGEKDQDTRSEILKLRGLEIISYAPHKFKQDLISINLMSVLKNSNTTWGNKQTALSIFNLIAPTLKGSQILTELKKGILQFVLSNNLIELYDVSLESLKFLFKSQFITPNVNEQIISLLKQMIISKTQKKDPTVTNIAEFMKYIQTHSAPNLEIQKLITSFIINIPAYFQDSGEHFKIRICQYLPKMLKCIDAIERSRMAQNLMKILLQEKEFHNQTSIENIPEMFECVDPGERFFLFKEVILFFQKFLDEEEEDSQKLFEYGQESIFKMIRLLSFAERQGLLKQQIKVLREYFEDRNPYHLFRSIPKIINYLERDEKMIFAKEMIDSLLNRSEYLDQHWIIPTISKFIQGLSFGERQILCKDAIKQIISQDIETTSNLCHLTPTMVEFIKVDERQFISKEIFEYLLKLIHHSTKNKILQSACMAILMILTFIEEEQRKLLDKDLIKSFQELLESNVGENVSSIVIWKIKQMIKYNEVDERTLFAKALIKTLGKILIDQNNNFNVRNTALQLILKVLKYVDLNERSQIAEDSFNCFESLLLSSDDKIKFKIISNSFQVLEFINLDKKFLLAKNLTNSLDSIFEGGNQTEIENSFPSFFSCFTEFITLIEETEKLIFVKNLIQSLEKCLIKTEMTKLVILSLLYIPKVIELVNIANRVSIAKNIIKEFEKCLEASIYYEIRKQACESISMVIMSLFTKEEIKFLEKMSNSEYELIRNEGGKSIQLGKEGLNIRDRQLYAQDAIKLFKNLLEDKNIEVIFSALLSIEEIIQILDLSERPPLAIEMIQFLEKKGSKIDERFRESTCSFIIKMFENLKITERTKFEDNLIKSIGIFLESGAPMKGIKYFSKIFDNYFESDNILIISNTILDILFHNKSKSIVDRVQKEYQQIFSYLKSQYEFISKIDANENNRNSISLSRIQSDLFKEEVSVTFILNAKSPVYLQIDKMINKIKFNSAEFQTQMSKIKIILLKQIYKNFGAIFGLPPNKVIHILLCIIGNENENLSSRKEVVKEAKVMVVWILKYLDQDGIDWIQANLQKLIDLSSYSSKIVTKVCEILLEDGIISDNENDGSLNEFKILVDVIRNSGNISLNDRGSITVDGRRYTLELNDNGRISLDKEISEMLKNHNNPFIRQYFEYKPVFLNNSQKLVASLDKRQYSIVDNEWSNKKWESVIDQNWKLVELEKYNGGKIVFFEKKDIFGKRLVLKINQEDHINSSSLIKIFDSNREKIFGKYIGPMMFYAQLSKHDSWKNNSKDNDFINCFKNKDKLNGKNISDKQEVFHDGLLCMKVTSDRMQDIVFFEFMKTIKDQEEELKHEIRKMSLENHQNSFLEYYGAFLKTFSICYTEAQVIASGKFNLNASNKGVTVLSKLASIIPLIGDIASSVVSSIGEFIVSIGIERKANSFLQFAHDHTNLSKKVGILAKQIILNKGFEFVKNNFEMGYVSMFITKQNSEKNKVTPIKSNSKLSEIANRVLKIQSGIEAKIYSELYVGNNAKLGNEDATKFIEMITNNGLCCQDIAQPTQYDENLHKMYKDVDYQYFDNDKSHKKKNGEGEQVTNCCNVFLINCIKYDNPFINMNKHNVELMFQLIKMNYLEILNITDQKLAIEKDEDKIYYHINNINELQKIKQN